MFDFRPSLELSGGIQKSPHETGLVTPGRGGVTLYFLVEDLEKTSQAIEKAGGKMVSGPVKEGTSGLYRVFEDTEGNFGGAYQFVGNAASS